jgi:hypothetical protein
VAEDPARETGETEETEQSQDARLDKLESVQAEQGGKLDQILALVKGKEDEAHDKAEKHTQDRLANPPAATIADQVRQAVKEVGAEEEQRRRQAEHDEHHKNLREQAERPPREPVSGFRGRLQSAMFGKDPR